MKKLIYILIGLSFPMNTFAQLQNMDFEICDTSVVPHTEGENCRSLEGWTRTNGDPGSEEMAFPFIGGGVSDAQNGDMALRLSVFYHFDKEMAVQRAPFTYFSFPESLSGYYTYTDNIVSNPDNQWQLEADTATVRVLLTKWDAVLNQRDTIGFGELKLNEALSYTEFSCPIDYLSTAVVPDSIHVLLNPSRVREENLWGGMGPSEPESSFFTVDNLSLEDNALGLEEVTETQEWKVYPNPGNGIIHIPNFRGSVAMYNLNGKLITTQTYPKSKIDASIFPSGKYILRLTEESGQVSVVKYLVHHK